MVVWRLSLAVIVPGINHYPFLWLYWGAIPIILVLVYGFNVAVSVWPIARLFLLRGPLFKINKDQWSILDLLGNKEIRVYTNGSKTQNSPVIIKSATRPGFMTGYEPRSLKHVSIPRGPKILGEPGKGLNNATQMSAQNIALGIEGEANFARALEKADLIDNFVTLWSVQMPDHNGMYPNTKVNTDIDCVLLSHDTIYLIDLKNYASGDVIYQTSNATLYSIDVATGAQIGQPKTMSRNMEMADSIIKKHFPRLKIKSVVVFMPTNKGEGSIQNVYWPGGIPAVNLSSFIKELNTLPPIANNSKTIQTQSSFANLIAR